MHAHAVMMICGGHGGGMLTWMGDSVEAAWCVVHGGEGGHAQGTWGADVEHDEHDEVHVEQWQQVEVLMEHMPMMWLMLM